MDGVKTNVKKSSLVATVLFAIAFFIYTFLMISNFETSSTSKNWQKGILAAFFGIMSIMNYLKYRRAKS